MERYVVFTKSNHQAGEIKIAFYCVRMKCHLAAAESGVTQCDTDPVLMILTHLID